MSRKADYVYIGEKRWKITSVSGNRTAPAL